MAFLFPRPHQTSELINIHAAKETDTYLTTVR